MDGVDGAEDAMMDEMVTATPMVVSDLPFTSQKDTLVISEKSSHPSPLVNSFPVKQPSSPPTDDADAQMRHLPKSFARFSPEQPHMSQDVGSGCTSSIPSTQAKPEPLPIASLATGLCYDVRMRYHATLVEDDVHPEDPRRIFRIYDILCQGGLVDDNFTLNPGNKNRLWRIEAREATEEEICLIHTPSHWSFIRRTSFLDGYKLRELTSTGDSIYYNSQTFLSAKVSAGGAIESCRAVVSGQVKNAIAVIRPPGHHAVPNEPDGHEAQGFCIFNNVSIAARVCQQDFPDTCRKILIFDWDVHHGNGTQAAFYEDPNVLYISTHVYLKGAFYPSGPGGSPSKCGRGVGLGKNVNVAWSDQGMGDGDYLYAFQAIVMPIAAEFDPDLVIVSAGFDAAAGDTIGGCFVTPPCYAHMLHGLMSLAKGKVVVCLEGGYNLDSISKSALAVTRTLMGEPPDRINPGPASRVAEEDVQRAIRTQSTYWQSMHTSDFDLEIRELQGERMHDVIRQYQSQQLYTEHKMITLMVLRSHVSESFRDQVLATQNYARANTLLFIVHDPPELLGISNPKTHRLDLHNTWLTDSLKYYIKWAVEEGFGVIDVNVPKYLTQLDDKEVTLAGEDTPSVKAMKDLVIYMWENYIEVSEATNVFFLGVGEAYNGVMHLLNNRDCSSILRGVINFICNDSIRSAKRDADPWFSDWYHKNSLVFVNKDHLVWSPDRKPPKRKFGRVMKSSKSDLSAMLMLHREQVAAWVEGRAATAPGEAGSTMPTPLIVP
ncbi:MAG: Histone deacetylase hda1 [Piccolia ochrophora]|nr:MAG: Histone deacetylase hda1 [Piccolia ochrophora]